MDMKKYVSDDKLAYYDKKIKSHIATANTKILTDSKEYSDSLSSNFDSAGSSATVQANLNTVENKVDDHIENSDVHFTSTERIKLAGIATKADKYIVGETYRVIERVADNVVKVVFK